MSKIYIAGLGPGSMEQISIGAYEALMDKETPVFIRTKRHPNIESLEAKGMQATYLDDYYEAAKNFEEVYQKIAERIVEEAKKHRQIAYAVPGHPFVAEKTVEYLVRLAEEEAIEIQIIPSMSFIDTTFAAVRKDPSDGFTLLNALTMDEERIEPEQHLLITQIYDSLVASEVKIRLLEIYPPNHGIFFVKNAGIDQADCKEEVREIPLSEMDHREYEYDHLTTIFVPATEETATKRIRDLVEIVRALRGEGGCPWDRKQTHESLREHIVEEANEVKEAIEADDIDNLIEELGDVLLHIVFHSELGRESGAFTLSDVIGGICEKLVFRHPHVFAGLQIDEKDLPDLWQKLKKEEKILKNE